VTSKLIAAIALSLLSAPLWAEDAPADAAAGSEESKPFAVTLWLVNDYKFRGVSQSQEDPAFQAALDYTHPSGFYAGIWGSSIDFTPEHAAVEDHANVEIDTYIGYKHKFADQWTGDIELLRYNYPGTRNGFHYNYNELIGKLTYDDHYTFTLGYSNDVFNSSENGIYYGLSGSWDLPGEFTLNSNVGYYDLDNALGKSYVDYGIGVSHKWGAFTGSLTYINTNNNGEDLFGTLASQRWVASLSLGL
jgi:uncharacterized protein (TIGR02001 family)